MSAKETEMCEVMLASPVQISVLMGEPYFSTSLLPWHSLFFWYCRTALAGLLRPDASILPRSASLHMVAVEFQVRLLGLLLSSVYRAIKRSQNGTHKPKKSSLCGNQLTLVSAMILQTLHFNQSNKYLIYQMSAAYVNSGHIQWLILISPKHEDCSQMKALLNVSSIFCLIVFVLFIPVSEGVKYSDHFLYCISASPSFSSTCCEIPLTWRGMTVI